MAILGIDEVGRGPWAGPLVIGAVVLGDTHIEGLTDSKALSAKKRAALAPIIHEHATVGLGWVPAAELDEIGLSQALHLATRRAVEQIKASFHEIIIDGAVNFLSETALAPHVTTLKKADLLISEVSAASIVAKVARDAYMFGLTSKYPHHGFERHVGYGTVAHRQAIEKHGLTPEHRHSFAPIASFSIGLKECEKKTYPDNNLSRIPKNTTQIGNLAETKVALFLESDGHTILARNWKTKFCEIDIVSQKGSTLLFTEAKYRRNGDHGGGLAAITKEKQRQMAFAAKSFVKYHQLQDHHMFLQVASVSGADYHIDDIIALC